MKKLLFVPVFLCLIFVKSVNAQGNALLRPPAIGTFVASPFVASNTVSANYSTLITSYPSIIHTLTINTTGSLSNVEIWDMNAATTSSLAPALSRAKIDTTQSRVGSLLYDMYFSSGIVWYNSGNVAANVTITYRER